MAKNHQGNLNIEEAREVTKQLHARSQACPPIERYVYFSKVLPNCRFSFPLCAFSQIPQIHSSSRAGILSAVTRCEAQT